MMSFPKSPITYAVSQMVAKVGKPVGKGIPIKDKKIVLPPQKMIATAYAMSKLTPTGADRVSVSLCCK